MHILIFEGIATSGKSTLIEQLKNSLNDKQVTVVDEDETHVPIMNETDSTHIDFFTNLVQQKTSVDSDVVIFDRLYLTQAYRAKVGLTPYEGLERLLLPLQPLTVFLKVENEAIAERVLKASQHRDDTWKDYIWTKGKTVEQIAQYYIDQQTSQLELLKFSIIPYRIFDTTEHTYAEITQQLVDLVA